MTLDPHLMPAFATLASGGLMALAGIEKSLLERRRRRRICPSCGRELRARVCSVCS